MPTDPDPIELPAYIWTHPDVTRLCQARDAPGLLGLIHRDLGIKQARIAYWMRVEPTEVTKLINHEGSKAGRPPKLSLARWQRIADALNMPDRSRALLGLAPRGTPAPTDPSTSPRPATPARSQPGLSRDGFRPARAAVVISALPGNRSLPAVGVALPRPGPIVPAGLFGASGLTLLGLTMDAENPTPSAGATEPTEREVIAMIADESARLGQRAAETNVHPANLDELDERIRDVASAYLTEPLGPLVLRLRAMRNWTFALLDGHQYPNQRRRLYVAASRLCGLLACASSDLGHYDAARTHARTAWLCAELADDTHLQAWVLGTQSIIAFWSGRRREAVAQARAGREVDPDGPEYARLASLEARACARLGDEDGARAALALARDTIDRSPDEGGILAFPHANQLRCAGDALLWLGDPRSGRAELEEALTLYESAEQPQGSYAHLAVTRMDLAAARLSLDDLDGAADALSPVLGMPAEHRVSGVLRRIDGLRDALASDRYRSVHLAQHLDGQLEWLPQSTPAALDPAADQ